LYQRYDTTEEYGFTLINHIINTAAHDSFLFALSKLLLKDATKCTHEYSADALKRGTLLLWLNTSRLDDLEGENIFQSKIREAQKQKLKS
jgi:hypothetical protein